jgi:heavy metal sensor kinase
MNDGRLAQIVQVGIALERTDAALSRYLQTVVVLIPLGVALAAVGGAMIARVALAPVDEMSMTARRITGEDLSERVARRGTDDELDRLAETLNAMLDRLDGAFAQMRRFTADAAHELRTPLTALKGGIEVTLRSARSAEEYRDVLVSSLEEVDRLVRLAEDLLLYSRSTAGLEMPRRRVELEGVVLEVLDVGTRLAHSKSVVVHAGTMIAAAVLGEPLALKRALLNLVENAIKYTPTGGRVEVSLTCEGGNAVLAVDDTGPGVEPAEIERIFQPFVRLDAARDRETGGAGLGLSIAQAIVAAHHGTLTVDRAPIGGARFTIRLPAGC